MEICIPLQFTKRTAKNTAMDPLMITVNNIFGHWFTDIDIRRYPDDMNILPTNNSVDIYNYSNAQMKYLPEKSVKKRLKICFIAISLCIYMVIQIEDQIMMILLLTEQKKICLIV